IVFLFLSSFIISLFLDLFKDKKYGFAIYFFFVLICIWNKQYILYLPLILYNMYLDLKAYTIIIFPLLLVNFSPLNLFLAILSIYLSIRTNQYNIALGKNKIIRDSLIEDTLYLKKYNEGLKINKEKN